MSENLIETKNNEINFGTELPHYFRKSNKNHENSFMSF